MQNLWCKVGGGCEASAVSAFCTIFPSHQVWTTCDPNSMNFFIGAFSEMQTNLQSGWCWKKNQKVIRSAPWQNPLEFWAVIGVGLDFGVQPWLDLVSRFDWVLQNHGEVKSILSQVACTSTRRHNNIPLVQLCQVHVVDFTGLSPLQSCRVRLDFSHIDRSWRRWWRAVFTTWPSSWKRNADSASWRSIRVTGDDVRGVVASNGVWFWCCSYDWYIFWQVVLADWAPICFALIWQTTDYGSYLAVTWAWKSPRWPTSFFPVGSIQFACMESTVQNIVS